MEEELRSDQQSMNQAQSELQELREKILAKTEEKDRIIPQFEEMVTKEKDTEKRSVANESASEYVNVISTLPDLLDDIESVTLRATIQLLPLPAFRDQNIAAPCPVEIVLLQNDMTAISNSFLDCNIFKT